MMKKTGCLLISGLVVLLACTAFGTVGNDVAVDQPRQFRVLSGQYAGPGDITSSIPTMRGYSAGEANQEYQVYQRQNPVYPLANEPIIDYALIDQVRLTAPTQYVRVIIYLDYQPGDIIREQVEARHTGEMLRIREQIREIHSHYVQRRNANASRDADNYQSAILDPSPADLAALRNLNLQHENLSRIMQIENTAAMSSVIYPYQQSVIESIENLGGQVEAQLLVGNSIIAIVPAGNVGALAQVPKIARVTADELLDADLNIADNATLVTSTATGGGLWEAGLTGGTYDPAILDSGTDLSHPALEDDAGLGRQNFYSWYLASAQYSSLYDDEQDEDDRNGHGTHVMGIVASYGSTGYLGNRGMAYGVETPVTLKAGFNRTDGLASMFSSDAMALVNRALYHTEDLYPLNSFNDDVDGINLSYGGSTTTDETPYSRFWDSVVYSYSDIVVTLSAGNSGPSNTEFSSPATSYNAITVANVNDQNTTGRNDDVIRSSSTRGPTANGRRKPDIAAPGSYIVSCWYNWESASDFVSMSGTSMAAPMVLGIAMDLMDAGVTDELEIKALLINTAQKNNTAMSFESDSDGWSTAYGWGYINAWAAYYHRNDVFSNIVTARPNAGCYRLYAGSMRDEGGAIGDSGQFGEGRDRATLVWNRHATYRTSTYPNTYYALSNLDLELYLEQDDTLMDTDYTVNDNVQQVRIDSGTGPTDVVVKVFAYDTSFAHGGATESFALATEEDFVEVSLPSSFSAFAVYPAEVEPGEIVDIEFYLHNDSAITAHNNEFDLILPPGWSLISGSDPYEPNSIPADGDSEHITWTVQAQYTTENNVNIQVRHTHDSYGELWGPFNWNMYTNVRWDNTTPSPDPMTWSQEPNEIGTDSLHMVATTASDAHEPIYYQFYIYNLTGGHVETDDANQTSETYVISGLNTNSEYDCRVRAGDNATTPNFTEWSIQNNEYTAIETPTGISFGTITSGSIEACSLNTPTGLTRGSSGLRIFNITEGTDSSWQQSNDFWDSNDLTANTYYSFYAQARNGDGAETAAGPTVLQCTYAALPDTPTVNNATPSTLDITINPNANPAYTEFAIRIVDGNDIYHLDAAGQNNGAVAVWQTADNWNPITAIDLQSSTTYSIQIMARNQEGVVTLWSPAAQAATAGLCGDHLHPYPTGDLNQDCHVSEIDLAMLAAEWLNDGCADPNHCNGADLVTNGTVDIADFAKMAMFWFDCSDPQPPCSYLP
ncbi:MAG: S8 family serine peptidase [Sedimentisphaerales bacterium]|nr:S8 family serine peptidase [Sedimentisphaerales bacterium]